MSEQENSPHPPSDDRKSGKRSSSGDGRKPERSSSSNLIWYLMIAGVVALIAMNVMRDSKSGKQEVKFSQLFRSLENNGEQVKLEDGTEIGFTPENVHELIVGRDVISFQDRPDPKSGESSEDAPPIREFYINAIGMEDDKAKLTALLRSKGIDNTYAASTPEWQNMLTLLFIPLMFILVIVFIFRRMGGAGSAMSFGRSRGRMYAQEEVESTFNEVAGIDEAVEELREVVEFLRTPAKYQALGGRIPRGVLLIGPPGTGKTLLAKAVAGEAGVPFYSLSGSDFVEMFVGVGAARVRDMFQQAAQRSPSIIFIDELDALGKVRGSGMPGGHDEREQTLNALLVEMDGFSSDHSVIVMAATNRPETLDPALLRPGRFDRHVMVDRPDVLGREAILKVHATKIKMDDSVDLVRLAKLTPGFVGADLANLVNEAALLAARNNMTAVTMSEFEEGIERVIAGLEKQTRIIHQDEKQRVAYHECGHALVACSLPNTDPVHKISIIPRGMAMGYAMQLPENDRKLITQSELTSRICVLLGGITSEEIIFQETSTGAQNDLQRATDIARQMVTEFGMSPRLGRVHYSDSPSRSPFLGGPMFSNDSPHSAETVREIDLEIKRMIDEAVETVHEVLSSRREVLEHMVRDLMEVEVMDSDHLQRILDEHKTGPQIKPGTYATASGTETDPPTTTDDDSPKRESADGA
ncbi:MAG: ATP-dependent zinc metalloprotease FtsH [Planctomycetaceae bacterium]|jgi:cell division protease FtsH|nr:ATP-dependent zinc metalloprotease FtsH [Planctomycetaceae bacterium]MBT6155769.1 ATP-dependent zinc metalloprotease FtsH [Planctomycetaceae bacterium]MBT6484563.1 ATP-dependent zinc metalloprotease FtsH [Planctomycetaceae bacterium]MBT6495513.1 ATP-dependent zinc metalloprotease FtsH [Planctomycetaceae bacterium]